MIIKKVGYLLLVKAKLFKLMAKLAPITMLASFILIIFISHLKEQYKFQQPSLRTKIFDIKIKQTSPLQQIPYQSFNEGHIKLTMIQGMLSNQCILITYPTGYLQQSNQIKTLYHALNNQYHNSKRTILLSYTTVDQFQTFMHQYYHARGKYNISLGIIRAGLNIQIAAYKKQKNAEEKDKAFLKIYSPTTHPDLDYFLALKQLIELTQITWSPCEQIHRYKYLKQIKKMTNKITEYFKTQNIRGFIDHVLCQFNQHIESIPSAHSVMMNQAGFQAGSIKFLLGHQSNETKVEKILFSFIKQFGMQQDHLHSANTLYYPFAKTYFVPLLYSLAPSLLMFVSLVIILINDFMKDGHKQPFTIPINVMLFAYFAMLQKYYHNNFVYSFLFIIVWYIGSILIDFIKIIKNEKIQKITSFHIYEISLLALQGLISVYFGIFCFSLSYISMIMTLLMLIKPNKFLLKMALKIVILSLTVYIYWPTDEQQYSLFQKMYKFIFQMSTQLQFSLIIPILHFSI